MYAARAVGWRGVLAVHTWIAVKPSGAPSYTRYEVIGSTSPPTAHGRAPTATFTAYIGRAVPGGGDEGIEISLLGLTFGLDMKDPALKLPGVGRVGTP